MWGCEMPVRITLYGDDADRFEELQERVGKERPGSKPGNAEMVRVLMDERQQ